MPFLKSMSDKAGPGAVFEAYPDIYGHWSRMSQALMLGDSPLSPAERELMLAFAAGCAGCDFVYVAHSEVAYARGVTEGLLGQMLADLDQAPVDDKPKPLLAYVRKLMLSPGEMRQADADAVFAAGWEERALQDAIAITARAAFMQRLVEGHGFIPMTQEVARKRAEERVEKGYVDLYPGLRDGAGSRAD